MEPNSVQISPKMAALPGSVHAEYSRCHRPGCRCQHGLLHGPYFRRHWMANGRKQSVYVRLADLPAVLAACARYAAQQPSRRALRRHAARLTAWMTALSGTEETT
jgi:hypothetical protein